MCGSWQTAQNALLGQEEGTGADGEEGALFVWVFLLQVRPGSDDAQGFGFGLEDLICVTARDDEDVEFLETLVGFGVVHVSTE